jgi:hypothetical protein
MDLNFHYREANFGENCKSHVSKLHMANYVASEKTGYYRYNRGWCRSVVSI